MFHNAPTWIVDTLLLNSFNNTNNQISLDTMFDFQ